jgi:hypothetical protein
MNEAKKAFFQLELVCKMIISCWWLECGARQLQLHKAKRALCKPIEREIFACEHVEVPRAHGVLPIVKNSERRVDIN